MVAVVVAVEVTLLLVATAKSHGGDDSNANKTPSSSNNNALKCNAAPQFGATICCAAATCHFGTLAHLLTISVWCGRCENYKCKQCGERALVLNRKQPYLPAASNSVVARADQSDRGKQRATWHGGSNA